MGFGHAVYRSRRSAVGAAARAIAESRALGGDLVERAIAVEGEILLTLAELKPDRALPSNVEYYAGVVMASAGVPRGDVHADVRRQPHGRLVHPRRRAGGPGKLIRPSARYVG